MIKSRDQSSHTYDEDVAAELVKKITGSYSNLLGNLINQLQKRYNQ